MTSGGPSIGVYSGNLLLLSPDGRSVLKCYARADHFRVERAALRALSGAALPVPRILGEGIRDGRPFLLLSRLQGAVPERVTRADGLGTALCRAFGALARALHDATRGLVLVEPDIPRRTTESVIERLPSLSSVADVGALRRFLETHRAELDGAPEERALLHRDLRFQNLLWDEASGRLSLLDFEVSATGHAHGDLTRTLLFELEPPLKDIFLEGYGLEPRAREGLGVFDVMFAVEMVAYLQGRASLQPEEQALMRDLLARLEV
jgi:aminoglycoside phosphotransferase (APT) family kinase protein